MGRDDGSALAARVPDAWGIREDPCRRSGAACWSRPRSGILLLSDLGWSDKLAGAIATAIMICGFVAFDAPARVRVRWHILNAPFVGLAAGLGVLTSDSLGRARRGGDGARRAGSRATWSPSPCGWRSAALTAVLALLITQGLFIPIDHTLEVAAYGVGGSLVQAAVAGLAWLFSDREREEFYYAARLEGHDCATSHELHDGQAGTAPRAALRNRDGGRRRDLPDRGLSTTTATGCR